MKNNKLIAYAAMTGVIFYFIYKQDVLQSIKNQLFLLLGFGILVGWLINKYVK